MKKIALFIPSLKGAGAEKIVFNLANFFSQKGYDVDVIVLKKIGQYLDNVNPKVRIINLNSNRALLSLIPLIRYLKKNNPYTLISSLSHLNIISIIAKLIINKIDTKVILVEHNDLRDNYNSKFNFKKKIVKLLMSFTYKKAHKVIAVSNGVLEYILTFINLDKSKVKVIYNPIFDQSIITKMREQADEQWLKSENTPLILGVGRFTEQKNFELLIRAFAIVRQKIDAKLIIIGEGHLKNNLISLAKSFDLQGHFSFPGFVKNPYKYMANSSLVVLSSNYEGFGNVLVEAMACGTQVISTDCNSGPSEILENGLWGTLVPVNDELELAKAIIDSLEKKKYHNVLKRAKDFSIDLKGKEYIEVIFSK